MLSWKVLDFLICLESGKFSLKSAWKWLYGLEKYRHYSVCDRSVYESYVPFTDPLYMCPDLKDSYQFDWETETVEFVVDPIRGKKYKYYSIRCPNIKAQHFSWRRGSPGHSWRTSWGLFLWWRSWQACWAALAESSLSRWERTPPVWANAGIAEGQASICLFVQAV